jgi:hypothetical protein
MADDNIITLSQIWSEIPFNTEASLKGMGHVLMIKFGKSRKTGLSGLPNQTIQFSKNR